MKIKQATLPLATFSALSAATASVAQAQTVWTAGTGNWNTAANWTAGVPNVSSPTAFDAVIENGGTAQLLAAPNGSVRRLRVGRVGGTGHLLVDGTGLSVTESLHLNEGSAGAASLTVRNGATVSSPSTVLGYSSAHVSSALISGSGTTFNAATEFVVGRSSSDWANLTVEAGADLTSGNGVLASNAGSIADAIVRNAGSSWTTTGGLTVGGAGTGILGIQDQALVHVGTHLLINSFSVLNMSGGTLRFNTVTNANRINYFGGTIQLGGARTIEQDPTIATLFPPTTSGAYTVFAIPSGKGLVIEGAAKLASAGYASLDINGGSFSAMAPGEFIIGEFSSTGAIRSGTITVRNGGRVQTGSVAQAVYGHGNVNVTGPGSTWNVFGDYTIGSTELGSTTKYGDLYVRDGGLVHIQDSGTLRINNHGSVYLEGGTIRFNNIWHSGKFEFNLGTLQLAGNRLIGDRGDADLTVANIMGAAPVLTPGKNLVIEGIATLAIPITVDGGAFTVGQLANAPLLDLKRGSLTLTNQAVTIQSGGVFGDQLQLKPEVAINVNQGTTNRGLIWGNGTLGGPVLNDTAGEIRASAADTLTFKGATTNSGDVRLIGGFVDFHSPLTNTASGKITGRGTLNARGGLSNQGHVALSSGISDVYGDVVNDTGNAAIGITVSGQADANFWGDVTNTSGLFRVSADSSATFFGNFSGGGISGGGDVYMEADVTPGFSPGLLSFGGNVHFGELATLQMEIGGTTPGSDYDQIHVAGNLTLDGTLNIALIDGFAPAAGQQFQLFTAGSQSGAFAQITGDYLGDGLFLNPVFEAGDLTLITTQAGYGDADLDGDVDIDDLGELAAFYGAQQNADWLNGDFDNDGDVDLSDLGVLATHYNAGQAQALADFQALASVPEPGAAAVSIVLLGWLPLRRARRIRR